LTSIAAAFACSSAPQTVASHVGSSSRQADSVPNVPLFFAQVTDLAAGAEEVDGSGNTYVAGIASATAYVDVFDVNGKETAHRRVRSGQALTATAVRVNDPGYIVGGQFGTDNNPEGAIQPHGWVWRYDIDGNLLFEFNGDVETTFGGADLCEDGTTVAVVGTLLYDFDASGNVNWSVTPPGLVASTKVRCLGDGAVLVAGRSGASNAAHAFAAQYESDGTQDFAWTGPDTVDPFGAVLFDIDNNGAPYFGATTTNSGGKAITVYALDTSGNVLWSAGSGGTADTFSGISVSDVVAVTGTRIVSSTETHYLTNMLDTSGNALWTREDAVGGSTPASAQGVFLDDADNPFVCGMLATTDTGALLYAAGDGSTMLEYDMEDIAARWADVTNGVGRCIGRLANGQGTGIVAFQVE